MNNNSRDSENGFFKNKLTKSMKLILLIILVSIITMGTYYFSTLKTPFFKNVFTTYAPINTDSSTYYQQDTAKNIAKDTSSIIEDRQTIEMLEGDSISNLTNSLANENIFKLNTEYKKLDQPKLLKKDISAEGKQSDLFFELLISDNTVIEQLDGIFSENPISYEAILKIVSITGQNILLNKELQSSLQIIESLVATENIADIHIIDRNGNLSHSTNMPKVNTSIWKFLAEFQANDNKISVNEVDGKSQIVLPLFHTYGKIGMAIISIH